jgi:hypothetical protein
MLGSGTLLVELCVVVTAFATAIVADEAMSA